MELKDFATIEQVRQYIAPKERMISHDMIVVFLTKNGCITSLQSATDENAKGFWLAVSSGVQEFNVMDSHPVGQGNQALLSHMVSVGAVNQAFADDCIAYANSTHKPYESVTDYEWKYASGQPMTKKPVDRVGGMAKITLVADAPEKHNPAIYQLVGDQYIRRASFRNVQGAGDYYVDAPSNALYVDDCYGVM